MNRSQVVLVDLVSKSAFAFLISFISSIPWEEDSDEDLNVRLLKVEVGFQLEQRVLNVRPSGEYKRRTFLLGFRKEKIFDRGVLHVEIFEARGIKGDEIGGIGKADPYLKLKHGSSSKREILKSTAHQG
ncbi:hypothetical protein R1sor_007517 [Riccia sorocarpa]|uniref:C2 domain-containing protein n=1 Tax=Riccia sorocarpa TaxID=122646 RepID=A0ABD3HUV0_9MARC